MATKTHRRVMQRLLKRQGNSVPRMFSGANNLRVDKET